MADQQDFNQRPKQPFVPLGFHRTEGGKRRISNRQIDFAGWILFIISAIGFIIASVGSFWAMVGSVFFLLACLVFIIPFFRAD